MLTARKFLKEQSNGIEPIIINGDQMPIHFNEVSGEKTLNLKGEDTSTKERYLDNRSRSTVMTHVSSDPEMYIEPQFVFKGKGIRAKVNPPEGILAQWAEKGSYRLPQLLKTIEKLPNRATPFNQKSGKNFGIYVLDDYAVHLMPEVRQAVLKRGYIPIVIGGGITGFCQINDTHFHHPLKAEYRKIEMEEMLNKLKGDRDKIPSTSRDDIINWVIEACKRVDFDKERAFKSLFVTNALNGEEDYLVSDRIYSLVGDEVKKFRDELMTERNLKNVDELMKKIIPPKGIKRKNVEGVELFDCEGDEIEDSVENEELDDSDDEDLEDSGGELDGEPDGELSRKSSGEQSGEPGDPYQIQNQQNGEPKIKPKLTLLSEFTKDPDILSDTKFSDELQMLLANHETSKLATPFIQNQKKAMYPKL